MNKKILGIIVGVSIIIIAMTSVLNFEVQPNEKIGLVINTPTQSVSARQIDEAFYDAASTGIGRSNVYLFWNIIEPERGEFDWSQSDILMGLNEKNNLKVTLYFSIINGASLGPFPDWVRTSSIDSINQDRLVDVLDTILARYHIVDTVIIAGETESQFRDSPEDILMYNELFDGMVERLKEQHPQVKFGNSFGLHHVLNRDLGHIVHDVTVGDFVAFSYLPVDRLNDIVKTPEQARDDLNTIFEMAPDKVAFFEVSWSTSDFVNGTESDQKDFIQDMFEFYLEHEDKIEFLTWYRQYDKPEGTCTTPLQNIGDKNVSVGGGSGLGNSDFVIERLDYYVCNAGLVDVDGNPKPGWNIFEKQIELIK